MFKRKLRQDNYGGGKVLSIQESNEILKNVILEDNPYMFGRYGSTELNIVTHYLLMSKGLLSKPSSDILLQNCFANGLYPKSEAVLSRFALLIIESSKEVDLFGTFRMIMEDYYIKYFMMKTVKLTHLFMMDFWLYNEPFTSALKGKKVLVIHPFAETIQSQYKKRNFLFDNPNVLPDFELKTLKAVQTIAGKKDDRFSNWFEALDYMYTEAMKIDFDVAIIGCGAYGFPLAAKIKKAGKIAIHMGGVTQMLFGIKGGRWDLDPKASQLYNEYWVRPSDHEVPVKAKEIEGGCYW